MEIPRSAFWGLQILFGGLPMEHSIRFGTKNIGNEILKLHSSSFSRGIGNKLVLVDSNELDIDKIREFRRFQLLTDMNLYSW